MLDKWLPFLIYGLFAAAIPASMIVMSFVFSQRPRTRTRARGLDTYYVTRRGFRDNLIQYLPTGGERSPEAITGALERFAGERRLPDRGRGILEHCLVSTGFPIQW